MLLGAPGLTTRTKGIATRSKDACYWGLLALLLEQRASLLGARMLLGAPGLTTRTKGIATRSKDATGGSWPYY